MVLTFLCKGTEYQPGQTIDGYTVVKKVGEGRYGICYLVCQGREQYILKQLKKYILKKTMSKADFEPEILKDIEHPGIPRFVRKINRKNFEGYLLEFKPGKTFEEIIFEDNYVFDKKDIQNIGMQLISILKYLHGMGVVHRDIRIPNTLFYRDNVYLVDFGLARWINREKYTVDVDFSYLGDFLLHLYYTAYETKEKSRPWYEELNIKSTELLFLKRLMGLEKSFIHITEVETEFHKCFS